MAVVVAAALQKEAGEIFLASVLPWLDLLDHVVPPYHLAHVSSADLADPYLKQLVSVLILQGLAAVDPHDRVSDFDPVVDFEFLRQRLIDQQTGLGDL